MASLLLEAIYRGINIRTFLSGLFPLVRTVKGIDSTRSPLTAISYRFDSNGVTTA